MQKHFHNWNLSEQEAIALQQTLAAHVVQQDELGQINTVAGLDVAYSDDDKRVYAAVVVLDAESLKVVDRASVEECVSFPYIPGLFSFREIPPLLKALAGLQQMPDLLVCDGQGRAHPRRFGLASHLGYLLDVPSIGCGKTRLLGEEQAVAEARGSMGALVDNGEEIGRALRTQDGIKPLYVSVGHKISLNSACDWILKLAPKYRQPETTRQADQLVRKLQKANI